MFKVGYDRDTGSLISVGGVRVLGPRAPLDVGGPNPPPTFSPVSRNVLPPSTPGLTLKTAPSVTLAKPVGGPPSWYTEAVASLNSSMGGAVDATASHGYELFAEDVFYLDRLIEKLREWEKNLLMRADAVRSKKKFS